MTSYKKYDNVTYSEDGSTVTYSVECTFGCIRCESVFNNRCPFCDTVISYNGDPCCCGAILVACPHTNYYYPPIIKCTVPTGLPSPDEDII